MQAVRRQRLRDGALRSGLYSDPADPGRYVETFVVESWSEHLRQHERVMVSDRLADERARISHRRHATDDLSFCSCPRYRVIGREVRRAR
jgi:hypothetical protein